MSGNVYSSGLVFPNGALINGIAQINQSTLPVTRPDGSALVVRDKWYNTASGEEWFWNGTYWLSLILKSASYSGVATFSNSLLGYGSGIVSKSSLIFIECGKMVWNYTNYSVSNYWQIQLSLSYNSPLGNIANFTIIPTYNTSSGFGSYYQQSNLVVSSDILSIRGWANKVGSPGNIVLSEGLMYRDIHL